MENKNCFAYIIKNGHASCMALKELYCKREECKFYKHRADVNIEKIKEDIRNYISYKKQGGENE